MAHRSITSAKAKMTLEQLRIFLTVAEQLHFTRAAEVLCITQPAVSAAIQTLEAEYNLKLFHRIGRHVELTEAGALLQAEAKQILKQVLLTERELYDLQNLQRGELRLGASFITGNYWLPDKISQFKRKYPEVIITCTLANAEEIYEGTASGEFDLGWIMGNDEPTSTLSLHQEIVATDRLQVVVGRSHPWFERSSVSIAELAEASWIVQKTESEMHRMLSQTLHAWNIEFDDLKIAFLCHNSEMVKAIVENGTGIAILPEITVKRELVLQSLRSISVNAIQQNSESLENPVQFILKLKHLQRHQTQLSIAFEKALISPIAYNKQPHI